MIFIPFQFFFERTRTCQLLYLCCVYGSALIHFFLGRLDPDSGGRKRTSIQEKVKKCIVFNSGCSFSRARDFSCSLDVRHIWKGIKTVYWNTMLGIWDVCPGSRFFYPRSNNTKEKGENISCLFNSHLFYNIEKDISRTTKNLNVTELTGWIREPESEIRDTENIHSRSRIRKQGSKNHRILDPQHCCNFWYIKKCPPPWKTSKLQRKPSDLQR